MKNFSFKDVQKLVADGKAEKKVLLKALRPPPLSIEDKQLKIAEAVLNIVKDSTEKTEKIVALNCKTIEYVLQNIDKMQKDLHGKSPSKPKQWEFTIERDQKGFIKTITAMPEKRS